MKYLFIIILVYTAAHAENLKQLQSERQQIINTIKQYKKELSHIQQQKKALQRDKRNLTHSYTQYKKKISQLSEQERSLYERILQLTRMCNETNLQLLSVKDKLKATLSYLHKFLLPSSEVFCSGPSDVLHMRYLLKEAIWTGYQQLYTIEAKKFLLERTKTQLNRKYTYTSALKEDTEKRLMTVSDQLKRTEEKSKSVDLAYTRIKKRIAELLTVQQRLDKLISKLRQQYKPTAKHLSLPPTKNIRFPLSNAQIIRTFGRYKHSEYNIYLENKGIDLQVMDDKVVKATDDGKVVYAGRFEGYGKLVIIDHGNEVHSLYAGLKSITTGLGENVKKGEKIGIVDDILHFELRIAGKPVNPLHYLTQ